MSEMNTEGVLFDRMADLFLRMDVHTSPSELHGLLCGQLSQGKSFNEQGWLICAAVYLERERIDKPEEKELLLDLYATTAEELSGAGFDLNLLLPDAEDALSLRAESLGRWCSGFLAGFGNVRGGKISDELRSSLDDLQEFVDIQSDDLDDNDDSERDLMQVEEYVRMVVILAYSEMNTGNQDKPGSQGSAVLH